MVSRGRRGSTSPARSSSLSKQVRCRERRKPRERADLARGAFTIGEDEVAPGERRLISLPMSALANRTPMALPVSVIHGKRDGPTLFVSAALHGDELTGVAICRRLLASKALAVTRGTLLMVPIVNAFGFIGHSRYLPDRRDLNRGSEEPTSELQSLM